MQVHPTPENLIGRLSRIDTSSLPADGGEHFNRLIFSKSPYLLQHAENPVDWYPWGEEAFARARAEDRPLFVSIGYSTCHWCHVMAHESFEDAETARVLNRYFIPVKVDREERPDIDGIYMAACQMMTGGGGWPLNVVVTPDGRPFFAATYLPKTGRAGMAGLVPVLEKIAELWLTDRGRLTATGEQVQEALRRLEAPGTERPLSDAPLRQASDELQESFDRQHAGFGNAPKFPMPHTLSLLLRIGRRTGEEKLSAMALQTLQAIRLGGIFDQIGFGLHRYSVDEKWLVPHFEKMLYDQALLIIACLDAFQASGGPFFAQTAGEVITYLLRDLGGPEGGFCCGEDADSEGAEGTFYLWTPAQVKEVLGSEEGTVVCRAFGITEEGNFERKSIPHLAVDVTALARQSGVEPAELGNLLASSRRRLFAAREKRVRPHRDDKILTAWNGLAVAALARAGAVLEMPEALGAAGTTVDFLLSRLRRPDGRLLRRYRRGEAAVPGFLEDYAFLVWGLLELYMAGFQTRHLAAALELTEEMEELFADRRGGYYDTGADAETVLTRGRSRQDGALPAGGSVAALNLLRLGRLTGNTPLEERGERLLRSSLETAEQYPSAFPQLLIALDEALGPPAEVVLAVPGGESPRELLRTVHARFRPHTTVLLRRPGDAELLRLAPAAAGKEPLDGRATAYLCRNRTCLPPLTDPAELEKLLQ